MANRVTSTEVKVIIDTDIADVTTPFIDNANLIVNENLLTQGYSDARLKMIEMYLAAHLVAITSQNGGLTALKLGDVQEKYGELGTEGYNTTRYGRQALSLEPSGTLKALGGQQARFQVL